ncbi:MAG: hypothetical protein R3A47_02615 [Polyangiales bacterium]
MTEPTPQSELTDAERFLTDSLPLRVDTASKIADLVVDLRLFGLPDDYWSKFGDNVRAVTADAALKAAKAHIHPESALVLIVGQAADFAKDLSAFGNVKVVDSEGNVKATFASTAKPR